MFGDKALLGDGGFRGDGAIFDDGVATRISLIGVPAEASKSVSKLDDIKRRKKQDLTTYRRYVQGETWSVTLDLRKRKTAAGMLQFMNLETDVSKLRDIQGDSGTRNLTLYCHTAKHVQINSRLR